MNVVSKGFAKGDIKVYKVRLPSETKANFENMLKEKTFPDVELVLARMYDVEGLGGGPVFFGDLRVVCSTTMSKFLGEQCLEMRYSQK